MQMVCERLRLKKLRCVSKLNPERVLFQLIFFIPSSYMTERSLRTRASMATCRAVFLLTAMAALVFPSAGYTDVHPPPPPPPFLTRSRDVLLAIEEMKAANYFTFVTLINMTPPDLIRGNVTIFMPDDRTLSKISLAQGDVTGFLLRHLIPSPLLLDHLQHIPSGSILPTSAPGYIMTVDNSGRRNISLNDVKLVGPDICTAGSSIRCHGVEGVLPAIKMPLVSSPPTPSCSVSSNTTTRTPAPLPPLAPSPALPLPHGRNSSSPQLTIRYVRALVTSSIFTLVVTWMI